MEGGVQGGTHTHLYNRKLSNLRTDKALESWQVLVVQFSARQLTHATDCLPALSGLAQKFQSQMGWRISVSRRVMLRWDREIGKAVPLKVIEPLLILPKGFSPSIWQVALSTETRFSYRKLPLQPPQKRIL